MRPFFLAGMGAGASARAGRGIFSNSRLRRGAGEKRNFLGIEWNGDFFAAFPWR